MALSLSRDVTVYAEQTDTVNGETLFFKIPVLSGYSFSQAVSSSEITLSEMTLAGGVSRRGKMMFNDSLDATEWNFSTYARPFAAVQGDAAAGVWELSTVGTDAAIHAVEEFVLAMALGNGQGYTRTGGTGWNDIVATSAYAVGTEETTFDFLSSDKPALQTFSLYFIFDETSATDRTGYKISNACVNTATMNFDVEGISTWEFSGMGKSIEQLTSAELTTLIGTTMTDKVISEGISSTDNFIRNRLTTMSLVSSADMQTAGFTGAGSGVYNIALTGGSITIENNISYLVPETLGIVNKPIEHVTGTRSVSGNFTAYLATGTGGDCGDLFDSLATITDIVTNEFAVVIQVGGNTSDTTRIYFNMPTCHLEVPSHSIDDVVAIETNFTALPTDISKSDGTSGDELSIEYYGK